MDSVGSNISMVTSGWTFDGIEDEFDEHVSQSIPFYEESHKTVLKLLEFFVNNDASVLDIGCSTGTLLKKILDKFSPSGLDIKLLGVDREASMVKKAQEVVGLENCDIFHGSFLDLDFENLDVITALYTFQFIHPSVREDAYNKAFRSIKKGGAFITFDKIRAADARFQDLFVGVYNDFKKGQGFSEDEIAQKTRSLRGAMDVDTSEANLESLRRAGFESVAPIFKWFCFEGILAIK